MRDSDVGVVRLRWWVFWSASNNLVIKSPRLHKSFFPFHSVFFPSHSAFWTVFHSRSTSIIIRSVTTDIRNENTQTEHPSFMFTLQRSHVRAKWCLYANRNMHLGGKKLCEYFSEAIFLSFHHFCMQCMRLIIFVILLFIHWKMPVNRCYVEVKSVR